MNRFDIINRIGDKYRVGNTETGEFSYAQALKTVGKDIKDYQKATTGTQHKFLDIRFENERLVVLVECKNKFSRWDKAKIQGQLQDYVRFEKAYSDKKIVAILAETDGDEVWVWFGQSVIIDDEHRMEEETVLRTFEEYENLCFGRVNDKIKVVDSIKTLNEKLHSDGINEKLRSQFVGTCLLALKNGLVYKNVKETLDPKTGKKLAPERVVLKSIKDILEGLLTRGGSLNKAGKLAVLNSKVLDDQDVTSLTYKELEDILQFIDDNVVPYINDKSTAGQDLLNLFFTTFNKYVGKSDKNQAFTPDHICDFMSKAIDAVITTSDEPKYNYVSRDSNGNGVVGFVDEIEGEEPFPAGAMSLALGGSFLGSCFIQKKPFYTAQNVAVLQEKVPLSDHTKLFIATLIRNECKIKYQAFGRELNAHFRKDFTIKLPVKRNADGIVFDETHEFSDDGYIPDWEWMDSYMRSLPYSDRL